MDPLRESGAADPVEARLDVILEHRTYRSGCPLCSSESQRSRPGLVSVARTDTNWVRNHLEDRLQHQLQGRLNDPARHRRNPQRASLPPAFGIFRFRTGIGANAPDFTC